MPPHVIAGHLAAGLVPIAALVCIVYALVPASRRRLTFPALAVALTAALACGVAGSGGSVLCSQLKARGGVEAAKASTYGHVVQAEALIVAIRVLLALFAVAAFRPLAPGRGRGTFARIFAAALVIAAVATLWLTITTLGAGAESVWSHHILGR